ncbi:hypothetical protein Zm00014a_016710 [Zea mays]|uniref:Uncharacterized protein n=1 Tax=Zea mays TaxID=4577 RepID=A0A3L6GAE2_MAIZE|nr:hypothetical protein Zm00014a_016710 [Zea mays]
MGKNQAYKAMQRARLGSSSGAPGAADAPEDGMNLSISITCHSSNINILHLLYGSSDKRSLKTERKDKDAKKRSKKRRKHKSSSESSSSSSSESSSSDDEDRGSRKSRSRSRSKRTRKEKKSRSRSKRRGSESEEEGPVRLSKFFGK